MANAGLVGDEHTYLEQARMLGHAFAGKGDVPLAGALFGTGWFMPGMGL